MKKLILATIATMAIGSVAHAEFKPLQPSKPFDNWSIGIKGGVITPLKGHNASFWENMRGNVGIEFRKDVAPSLGLGIEGEMMFNTSTWNRMPSMHNAIDMSYVGVFGAVNLNNLFAGYTGQRRLFEVEAVAGLGWLRTYRPATQGSDYNDLGAKTGLNLNFNLGENKAWTVGIKPTILWNMSGQWNYDNRASIQFHKHRAAFELQAGVTYHFGNSNGTHSFAFVEPCDYTPYNEQINALRAENAALAAANAEALAANAAIAAQLEECLNRPAPAPQTIVKNNNTLESVRYVFYKIGSSKIGADQIPNVEMIADYMKHNPSATVEIKGYASKDGNLDYNIRLAKNRAEAVRTMLINRFHIKADRIKAEGQGIGEMFKEESWNRVAICILNEAE